MSDKFQLTEEMLEEITGGMPDVIWMADDLAALRLAESVEEIASIFDKKGLAFGADKAERIIRLASKGIEKEEDKKLF